MKRLSLVAAVALAIALAAPVFGGFPTPGTPPLVPASGGGGTSGQSWTYCYVNQSSVAIPAFTPTVLCSVTVGPGTWKFSGQVSAFVQNTTGLSGYSLDIAAHGGWPYYGASTGSIALSVQNVSLVTFGLGAFTDTTTVDLRWYAGGKSSLTASAQFDTGPTAQLIAERLSDSTEPLP